MASTKTTVKTIRLTNETADFFEGKPLNRYVECLHSLIESGKVKMDGDSLRVTGKSIYDSVPPEVTANFADLDDILEGGVAGLMVAVNNLIEDGLLNTDYSICGEPWVEKFRDACNAKGLKVENVSEKAILALQKGGFMTNLEAVEIIKTEKKCVLRNMRGCNRDCGKCDLVLPEESILLAYDMAIRSLSRFVPVDKTVSLDEEDDRK